MNVMTKVKTRLRLQITGTVQGVGFRPFIYRLAHDLALAGWVVNTRQGVIIEVEGPTARVDEFQQRIETDKPAISAIYSLESTCLDVVGYVGFTIRESDGEGESTALLLPDIALCADCRGEILDPTNRRFRYPFTNCTNCGPRFSIIAALPYDRPNTTMRGFAMCPACLTEYHNPADRRFHAQPNACPECGPHVELWDRGGTVLATHNAALHGAVSAIHTGQIVAVKGLGGFHLLVDARNADAVNRLRTRKHREEKPFALMFPSLAMVETACDLTSQEMRVLTSPASPIVLLRRHADTLAPGIAPGNPYLGVMLPYTPLHHLLLTDLNYPVVATSGNLSDEPISIDEDDAVRALGDIADIFLVHNRPILRHVDDSLVRVLLGREMVLRRARGYAPLPVISPEPLPPLLAVGGHLKNTVAVSVGQHAFLSQHIGDLETVPAYDALRRVAADLQHFYRVTPVHIASDLHPDYLSSRFAREQAADVVPVQHHLAHVLAGMADNALTGTVLGVAWDGTGLGMDGTVWGSEFLVVTDSTVKRLTHFRPFPLPGGDQAMREPRRSALGLLYAMLGDRVFSDAELLARLTFSPEEIPLLRQMLVRGINAPLTCGAGRLFDAVAALIGLHAVARFEGQAAMALEFATIDIPDEPGYNFPLVNDEAGLVLDWASVIQGVLHDLAIHLPHPRIAARFHHALAASIVSVAQHAALPRVVLSGGCFQNARLLTLTVEQLRQAGFSAYWHQRVPPNDGGIALGQLLAVAKPRQWVTE